MTATREHFGSRLGFILAAAGSAVGIGNLVGFPVNAVKNGGAAFLFIYALFVVGICLPVMLAELAAGRASQRNPLGAFRHFAGHSLFATVGGWLSLITPYMIAVFYSVITLWVLGYLVAIVSGDLQQLSDPAYFGQFINSPQVFLFMALIALIVGVILHFGVKQGIERAAKVMMPMLFVMLVGMVIFVLTLDNAMAGVKYYLIPDFSKINAQVINGAMGQAFFSLSLGMGILITYGSYMERNNSIPGSAKMVALTDTAVAFTAGLLVIPAIFSFDPGTNAEELSTSSVALVFTFLPKIFLAMQSSVGYFGASVAAAVFFLLVLFAALTSLVSIIEVSLAGAMDQNSISRNKALAWVGGSMVVVSIACAVSFGMVPFFTGFTHYAGIDKSFFDVVVDVFYDTILPLNGLMVCLLVIYRWRKENFNRELEVGETKYKGTLLERYTDLALGTFIPVILLLVFINTVLAKFFAIHII
ncbi:sodium-dependent transporter [Pseudomaricurvus sp. HS19]|uniref:sodium-dependent transporter n=1 Tax=Pseudomaricurvus sp. HS19 TaxID=2692626 RepID=UPI00136B74E1|nr:sodium-dependent transporter [Pseudomaricurvus sp. HS19]MYM64502.1 sodium-dependent transporter [Pseudomaricurvus sp. HS19]